MKKIKDPILLGVTAGLTGVLLKYIGNIISTKLGYNKTSYAKLAAKIYMSDRDAKSPLGKKAGILADAAIGAGLGVGYVYVLKFTGKDHALMKGVGYSHGVWTLLLGGANIVGGRIFPLKPKSILSTYVEHSLYGLGLALTATNLGDDDLFQKEDIDSSYVPQKP